MAMLGPDIAGTRFDFQVEVRIGAGAFVCGEETALIASIREAGAARRDPGRPTRRRQACGVGRR